MRTGVCVWFVWRLAPLLPVSSDRTTPASPWLPLGRCDMHCFTPGLVWFVSQGIRSNGFGVSVSVF